MSNEKNNVQTTDDIRLNFYSGSALIAVIIAAATTVLAFISSAKPQYYLMQSYFGKDLDDYTLDMLSELGFTKAQYSKIGGMSIAVSVLCALSAILMVIVVAKVMNPETKPAIIPAGIAFVMSLGALITEIALRGYNSDVMTAYIEGSNGLMEKNGMMTMGEYAFIAVIANLVVMLIMMIGMITGYLKWDKTGKTI